MWQSPYFSVTTHRTSNSTEATGASLVLSLGCDEPVILGVIPIPLGGTSESMGGSVLGGISNRWGGIPVHLPGSLDLCSGLLQSFRRPETNPTWLECLGHSTSFKCQMANLLLLLCIYLYIYIYIYYNYILFTGVDNLTQDGTAKWVGSWGCFGRHLTNEDWS